MLVIVGLPESRGEPLGCRRRRRERASTAPSRPGGRASLWRRSPCPRSHRRSVDRRERIRHRVVLVEGGRRREVIAAGRYRTHRAEDLSGHHHRRRRVGSSVSTGDVGTGDPRARARRSGRRVERRVPGRSEEEGLAVRQEDGPAQLGPEGIVERDRHDAVVDPRVGCRDVSLGKRSERIDREDAAVRKLDPTRLVLVVASEQMSGVRPRVRGRVVKERGAGGMRRHRHDQHLPVGRDLAVAIDEAVGRRVPQRELRSHLRPDVRDRIVDLRVGSARSVLPARDEDPAVHQDLRGVIEPRVVRRREHRPCAVHVASVVVRRQAEPARRRARSHHRAVREQEHQGGAARRLVRKRRPSPCESALAGSQHARENERDDRPFEKGAVVRHG